MKKFFTIAIVGLTCLIGSANKTEACTCVEARLATRPIVAVPVVVTRRVVRGTVLTARNTVRVGTVAAVRTVRVAARTVRGTLRVTRCAVFGR